MVPKEPTISAKCREASRKAHAGAQGCNWKGGRTQSKLGYIYIYLPDHPNGKNNGYVAEHRLKMEQKLRRYLKPHESVHHRNAIKSDNRMSNLELMTKKIHRGHVTCPHCEKEFTIR